MSDKYLKDEILYRGKLFQVISRSKESSFMTEDADGKSHEVKKKLTFELVRRPPGVRAIIVKDGRLLLNKEYRYELEDWDYRLPGGKVFDSTEEFERAGRGGGANVSEYAGGACGESGSERIGGVDGANKFERAGGVGRRGENEEAGEAEKADDLVRAAAYDKLAEEILEEADIKVEEFRLFGISRCGLTVEWDLYYFVVDKFEVLPSFYAQDMQKSEYEYIQHVWADFAEVENLILDGRISEDRSIAMIFKYIMEQKKIAE